MGIQSGPKDAEPFNPLTSLGTIVSKTGFRAVKFREVRQDFIFFLKDKLTEEVVAFWQ